MACRADAVRMGIRIGTRVGPVSVSGRLRAPRSSGASVLIWLVFGFALLGGLVGLGLLMTWVQSLR
jgi:hypothetical protein